MKHLPLVIMCLFFFCTNSLADNVPINLYKQINEGASDRSMFINPVASYDSNYVYLYSDISLEDLQMTIKDERGETQFVEKVTVFSKSSASVFIGNFNSGTYLLELDDGKNKYWGYFEVE